MKHGRFERGDVVRVYMTRFDVFPWQKQTSFDAVFMAGPAGPGDCFHLVVEGGIEKSIFVQLNGNSSDFVAMVEEK